MKKILSIVLALIMMLAVLSACADGNKTPESSTTPEVSTTPDGGDNKPATDIAGWMSYSFEKVVATNPVPEESKRNTEITLYMTKNEKESATLSVYTKNRISGAKLVLTEKPDVFDPRPYLTVARAEVKAMVAHKIKNVLGSANTL